MKNNFVYGLSNPALRQAQEGVVELHLPPVDMTAVLKEVDKEFVKQHPVMKKVLEEELSGSQIQCEKEESLKREREEAKEEKRERIRVSKEAFLNVNTPLKSEVKTEEKVVMLSDTEIESNRLSEEEMMKLPQMHNVQVGVRVFSSTSAVQRAVWCM